MRKFLMSLAQGILVKWLHQSVRNEIVLFAMLFLIKFVFGLSDILTDDDDDNEKQVREYAVEKLPELKTLIEKLLTTYAKS